MSQPFFKRILFPFWFIVVTPILWVSYIFSDYSKGWRFKQLMKEAVKVYWGEK